MSQPKKHPKRKKQFAICVDNTGYPVSLELLKVYQVLPDPEGEKHRMIRVIDESGEDYLFPAKAFTPVAMPARVSRLFKSKVVA